MSHRRFAAAAIAALTMLAVGLAQSAGARGHQTECNKAYSNRTFHGGVVVNTGDNCTLTKVVINGDLTVTGGKFSVQNSVIHGNWLITGGTGANHGDQCGNNMDGILRIEGTSRGWWIFGETDRSCPGGRINGGVRFENNVKSAIVELDGYHVNGGLIDTNNTGHWNEIEGNTIHGSDTCTNNNVRAKNDEGGPNKYNGKNTGCPG